MRQDFSLASCDRGFLQQCSLRFLRSQQGLSLIELMVTLVIASLLGIGLVQIFGGTRLAFNTNLALARAQENARFALEALNHDLRMTGHLGTRNEQGGHSGVAEDPFSNYFFNHMATATGGGAIDRRPASAPWIYRLDMPFQVYEFNGTGVGASVVLNAGNPLAATAASQWAPALPPALSPLVGSALVNSDIIVIRYLSAEFVTLVNSRARSDGRPVSPTIPFVASTGAFAWEADAAFPNFIENGGIYAFSNARAVSLFQVSNVNLGATEGTAVAGGTLDWMTNRPLGAGGIQENPADYGSMVPVHRYELVVYYTAIGADGGPALFRRRLSSDGLALGAAEEMVNGVESIQVVLSAIRNLPRASDQPTGHVTADAVGSCGGGDPDACWRAVVGARVGLLVRSNQSGNFEVSGQTYDVAGTRIQADNTDRRYRYVYETQVSFRNRSRG